MIDLTESDSDFEELQVAIEASLAETLETRQER